MNKPAVFYHYAIKDDLRSCFWSSWLDEQLGLIEKSGLSKYADVYMTITMPVHWHEDARQIRIFRNKTHEPCLFVDKVREYLQYRFPWVGILDIRDIGEPLNLYEGSTLKELWWFSKVNSARPVCYVHAKGIFSASVQVKLWREILNEIHINQWRQRLDDLRGYDVVGMADATTPLGDTVLDEPTHTSGNFFWADSKYVATLPQPLYTDRYRYEKWIMLNQPKVNFVYNTHVDHFMDYPNEP